MTDDIGRRQSFNTAIAAVMELVNELSRAGAADPAARFAAETAVSLIQPYAPHVAEELWERLGHERLWEQPWPVADEAQLVRDTFELVVQVNGKVRDRFEVDAATAEDELVERAVVVREGAGAHGRRADAQDDRRPGQARELRRRLASDTARRRGCPRRNGSRRRPGCRRRRRSSSGRRPRARSCAASAASSP